MTSSPWEGRRVLVTGGSGVIGVELLEWSPGTDLAAGVGRLVELYRGQGG